TRTPNTRASWSSQPSPKYEMRQRPRSVCATCSSPTGESKTSYRTSTIPSPSAAARKRASRSGVTFMCPPQSSDAGRRRAAGGLPRRAERVGDLGIGEVVAVAEHHSGTLGRRQAVRQMLELAERVSLQLDDRLAVRDRLRLRTQLVHRDVRRDREDPRPQVLAV